MKINRLNILLIVIYFMFIVSSCVKSTKIAGTNAKDKELPSEINNSIREQINHNNTIYVNCNIIVNRDKISNAENKRVVTIYGNATKSLLSLIKDKKVIYQKYYDIPSIGLCYDILTTIEPAMTSGEFFGGPHFMGFNTDVTITIRLDGNIIYRHNMEDIRDTSGTAMAGGRRVIIVSEYPGQGYNYPIIKYMSLLFEEITKTFNVTNDSYDLLRVLREPEWDKKSRWPKRIKYMLLHGEVPKSKDQEETLGKTFQYFMPNFSFGIKNLDGPKE